MLAIDWNSREIRILEGKATREALKLNRAVTVPLPVDLDPSDPGAWGQFLKNALRSAGISARSAVTCLDRRNLVLKTVPLADVGEEEVPEVVRLQALRDLTMPVEEMTIDHLSVAPANSEEEPHAVLAAVRTEMIEFYRKVFQAAGLTLAGLWPASLARVRAAFAALPPEIARSAVQRGTVLLVVADGDSVELALLRGEHFVMSAARPVSRQDADPSKGSADGAALRQVIRRLWASLASQMPSARGAAVLCAGIDDPASALGEEILAQVGTEPVTVDPLAGLEGTDLPSEERGAFASAVGSIVIADDATNERINFLAPKKTVRRPDRRRPLAILASGIVLLAGLWIHRYYTGERDRLQGLLSKAKASEKKLKAQAKELEPVKRQAELIGQWRAQGVEWLDLLRRFFESTPEIGDLFLTQMSMVGSGRPSGPIATIRIEGFANSQLAVTELTRRLMTDGRFEVHPGAIQPSGRFESYPWRFSADIGVKRQQRAKGKARG